MPWTASGSDSWQDRRTQSECSTTSQRIEVRRIRRFEFGFATWFEWQSPQPIADNEDDFRTIIFLQFASKIVRICHE